MPADWGRLANYLRAAMREHGWTSQEQFARAAGVSERTIRDLLSGRDRKMWPTSLPAVENALDWEPGTAERILAGGGIESVPRSVEARRHDLREARRQVLEADRPTTWKEQWLDRISAKERELEEMDRQLTADLSESSADRS